MDEIKVKQILTGKFDLKSKVEHYLKCARLDYQLNPYDEDDYILLEVEGTNYLIGYSDEIFYLSKIRHIAGTYYDPPDEEIKNILKGDFYEVMRELSHRLIDDTIHDMKEAEYEDSE